MSVNNYLIRVSFSYDFLEQQKNYVRAKYIIIILKDLQSSPIFCAHYTFKADVIYFIVFLQKNVVNRNREREGEQ